MGQKEYLQPEDQGTYKAWTNILAHATEEQTRFFQTVRGKKTASHGVYCLKGVCARVSPYNHLFDDRNISKSFLKMAVRLIPLKLRKLLNARCSRTHACHPRNRFDEITVNSRETDSVLLWAYNSIRIEHFTKRNNILLDKPDKERTSNSMYASIARCIGHFLIIYIALISAHSNAADVIVNPSVSQSTISQNTLRAIFGMRLLQWPNGEPITVFVLPLKNPVHENFIKERLGVFPHQLERNWDLLVFSGTGQPPIRVRSEQEMRKRIAETPGAIGYLSRKDFDENVRLLPIQ